MRMKLQLWTHQSILYSIAHPMKNIIKSLSSYTLDSLFPPVCLNCKAPIPDQDRLLCGNCFAHIHLRIGRPQREPEFYILAAATDYEEPMPALIRWFKYGKLYPLEMFLSALLVVYLKKLRVPVRRYRIASIPLHFLRERKRGFNQSAVLAKHIAAYFGARYVDVLSRTDYTKPQAKLKIKKRAKNIAGCFICARPDEVKNKNIIIVDDVTTTGATLREACAVLKKHGARSVIALVISKA